MTYQFTDSILVEGEMLSLFSLPLKSCSQIKEVKLAPKGTAVLRRYIATWKIAEQKLFLVDIDANTESGEPVTVKSLFPDVSGDVLSEWFTGTLVIPRGALLEDGIFGFDSIYEESLLIEVVQGEVVRMEHRKNEVKKSKEPEHHSQNIKEPSYLDIPDFLRNAHRNCR